MSQQKEGPDQARSWVIAIAACFIYILVAGLNRASGLFYVAIIETYGVSRLQANLPFTMRNVVKNLAGPLVGAIGQRYGSRDVTIVGGVLASLGIILCTFAPNVLWITIFWGGMHGLGVALGSTLSQVIVPQYFLKYRATASGFSLSGPCLGSFFLPIVLEYLLTNVGLAGTFLMTGGLVLHVLPASILMVEPPWIRRRTEANVLKSSMECIENKHINNEFNENSKELSVSNLRLQSFSGTLKKDEHSTVLLKNNHNASNGIDNPSFTGSTLELLKVKSDQVKTLTKEDPSITKENDIHATYLFYQIVQLMRNPMFHMISLSFAAFAMVVDPALTVIVDYLMDKGLKEDVAKYFISLMALGDLIGRMGFGWVTDRNYISVPKFMMLLHVGLGLCFLLLPVFSNFDSLMTVLVIYGLISGVILVMFPVLVGNYLKSVQSLAIGFIAFSSGLLNLGIPPLIGYCRDRIGSYDGMFYITGIASIIVGFFWLFEPFFVKLNTRKASEQSSSNIDT
ncbi:hypothetical protein JTE90_022270 [Oedothorax gibbosus]|uniref:Major facilitator superfamily (MFS) profile domain-containing protein n=1 Tax=Oedothorax gibbosus TaxID=931172 RepID=A0AAV6VX15_9ARAC|nr:hypothetical protein JTE90_022270 [Oedothorax gibbosus]